MLSFALSPLKFALPVSANCSACGAEGGAMSAELALLELIRVHGRDAVEAAVRESQQPVPRGQILCQRCNTLRPSIGARSDATRCPNQCISPLPPEELKS